MDKVTNRSRGFAFVEMKDTKSAEKAIRELNGITLDNRPIKVNEARRKDA
jgi:RNA recognition motif-containing protein